MNISPTGIDLIESFEGFSSKIYNDIAKIPTIGYGHKLLSGESFSNGITESDATKLMLVDLEPVESTINSLVTYPINQNQYDALCSFTYNVGCHAFRNSHMLICMNQGMIEQAANQFPLWDNAGGVKVEGLKQRRLAEQSLFLQSVDNSGQKAQANDNA